MNSAVKKKMSFQEIFKFISTVISWTIFTLLIMCAILLIYYFVSTQIYAVKGEKYAPKFSLYTIMSGSMVPNIGVYDVVVNTKVDSAEALKIGDVITFKSISPESMDLTMTHRIISIIHDQNGVSYVTKGDNNPIQDSTPVPYRNVIGKVALKIPFLGQIQVFVAQKFFWLLLLLFPALCILLKNPIKKLINKGVDVDKFVSDPLLNEVVEEDLPEEISLKDIKIEDVHVTIFKPDNNQTGVEEDNEDFDLPDLK